jgi:hypothetical protein
MALYIDIAVYLLVSFIIVQLVTGKFDLLDAFVFALPFKYAYIDIGFVVTLSQAILVVFLGYFFLTNMTLRPNRIEWNKNILLLVLYASVSTLLVTHLSGIEFIKVLKGNFFREEGRYILQIFVFIYFYFQIIAISNYLENNQKIIKLFRIYISAVLVLALIGLFQLSIYLFSGADIFPLGDEFWGYRTGGFRAFGVNIMRISSLGGEPKGTGITLAVGITLLILLKHFRIYKPKFYNTIVGILFLTCVLTFSTSAFFVLITMILMYIGLLIWKKEFKIRSTLKNVVIISSFIIVGIVAFKPIAHFFEIRVVRQMSAGTDSEAFDATIFNFLKDSPQWTVFGSGLGNIHNLVQDYIPLRHQHYLPNTVFAARSGILQMVADIGLVGLGFFGILLFKYCNRLNARYRSDPLARMLLFMLMIISAFYMIRGGYVGNEFILILSVSSGYLILNKRVEERSTIPDLKLT